MKQISRKPRVELVGNDHLSDQELFDLSAQFQPIFDTVVYRIKEFAYLFTDGYSSFELIPLIILTFTSVTTSFLESIGADFWVLIKRNLSSLILKKQLIYQSVCEVQVRFKNEESDISFHCTTNNVDVFETAFNNIFIILKTMEQMGVKEKEFEYEVNTQEWKLKQKRFFKT